MIRLATTRFLNLSQKVSHLPWMAILCACIVVVVIAISYLTIQLRNYFHEEANFTSTNTVLVPGRAIGQVQRELLKLQYVVLQNKHNPDKEQITLQQSIVMSRINVLNQPFYTRATGENTRKKLAEFDARWRALEPQFELWLNNTNDLEMADLISAQLAELELIVNDTILISTRDYQHRIIERSAQTNQALSLVIRLAFIFTLLLILMGGVVYHMFRQRRLAAEALMIAKDEAVHANKVKSEFLANMSHELRTPMNGVIGMLEIALHSELSTEQRSTLETANSSAHAMVRIINDILDISKVESGKMELVTESFDLHNIIDHAISLLMPSAAQKGLNLSYQIGPDIPQYLVGDVSRLGQVLINLVGNAIKFTQEGLVSLSVALEDPQSERDEYKAGDNIMLHFCVTDSGMGIPREKLNLIFKPFTQADTSATRKFGGTGLGLTISKTIIKLMGGDIWVESDLGKGSRFHFTASFTVSASEPCHSEKSTADSFVGWRKPPTTIQVQPYADAYPKGEFNTLSVLLVEDNLVNQKVLKAILKRHDIYPDVAENGQQALALIQKYTYDLILMDIQMPVMNGLEATRKIRQLESATGDHTPIIAMTANAIEGDRDICIAAGMDAYITKPINVTELLETIRELNSQPKHTLVLQSTELATS